MPSELIGWLTEKYPIRDHLSIWKSHQIGMPVGGFLSTQTPLRILAPTTYECDIYGGRPILDNAGIILKVLSQLPDSTALISTFWQTLMLGDLGLFSDHNRLPNDLDVAIISPTNQSWIFLTALKTCKEQVAARNKYPPFDMFSSSISWPHWMGIPPTIQIKFLLPYLRGEQPQYRPLMEIHPQSSDPSHQETFQSFLRNYAPFRICSHGLDIVAISAQPTEKSDDYDCISEYPPQSQITETILRIFPAEPSNHTITLTAHDRPEPRLGMIGPRIALAAVIGGAGKQEPMEINAETIRLIKESLGLLSVSEKRRVDEKVRKTTTKVDLVQHHLDRAANELKSHAYRNMRAPRIPFPKSESPLRDAFKDYLRILGCCYP